jgi:hypothetical protein
MPGPTGGQQGLPLTVVSVKYSYRQLVDIYEAHLG